LCQLLSIYRGPPTPQLYPLSLHDALPIYARLAELDRRARFRVHRAEDHAAVFSRTWRWVRPSSPDMPRMRSGLTASVRPIVRGEDRKSTRPNFSHVKTTYAAGR